MGVAHGHVPRQGPSLRLRSAGSAGTRLLPGAVADAWSDSWLLAAASALHRCRRPSCAALATPLRIRRSTSIPLRIWAVHLHRLARRPPRRDRCSAACSCWFSLFIEVTGIFFILSTQWPTQPGVMDADSLRRWTSLASGTFTRSQEPVTSQATIGSFRCGPQLISQLAG
jgi:hypothetical protein